MGMFDSPIRAWDWATNSVETAFLGVDVTKDKGIMYPLNTNVGYQIFTGRGIEIPLLLLKWNTNTNLWCKNFLLLLIKPKSIIIDYLH